MNNTINYRLNNIRFNPKKDLFFLNITREVRGDQYYNESINIQLKTRDMTKIYNYINKNLK